MTNFFHQQKKGTATLPLLVLFLAALFVGWVVVAYLGKGQPSEETATSTVSTETEKEQDFSLAPPPKVVTPTGTSTTSEKTKASVVAVKNSETARITLSSDKSAYVVGEDVLVSVKLTTNAETSGSDVLNEYDPLFLELVKANPVAAEQTGKNVAGAYLASTESIYGDFPQARLIDLNGKKVFVFSSLSKPQQSFKGEGVIATLRFKTLKTGSADVKVLATPGQTNDSNVAYKGQDILKEVKNVTVSIR
jgi:hypothetical protein